jgi:hypothetical protein
MTAVAIVAATFFRSPLMIPNTLKNTRLFSPASRSVACGLAVAALLAGCGGGDDPAPPANTLSGVAAVGLPIANGAVALKCSGGPALAPTTTNAAGNFAFTLAGQALPCAVQVNGGSIGGSANTTPYHSIAVTLGTVNITPLTNLMVAQLTSANPQTWFGAPVFTNVNASAISTALSTLTTGLGVSTLGTVNPITTAFTAQAGDPLDDWLEAFRLALATVGQNYAATLSAAQSGNYSAFTTFAAAFNNAFAQITTPVTPPVVPPVTPPVTPPVVPPVTPPVTPPVVPPIAPPVVPPVVIPVVPPVTPPASGSKRLTVEVSLSGSPLTTVDVGNVPAPANQAEFCSELQNDATFQGLNDSGGTLTINSCSFVGNVGQVSATLGLTSPFPLTFPYSIKYTYN